MAKAAEKPRAKNAADFVYKPPHLVGAPNPIDWDNYRAKVAKEARRARLKQHKEKTKVTA